MVKEIRDCTRCVWLSEGNLCTFGSCIRGELDKMCKVKPMGHSDMVKPDEIGKKYRGELND